MKKILILVIFLLGIFSFSFSANASEFEECIEGEGKYHVTNRVKDEDLDFGLHHYYDIAESTAERLAGDYITDGMSPQAVNILEVPTTSDVRIVNWTYSSNTSWMLCTVRQLAEDFEAKNPGWVVLAGTNGDFFDISGTKALPRMTSGAAVNNGEVVYASTAEQCVGFTNNGTTTSILGNEKITFSDHFLSIFDENGKEIKKVHVDKMNEEPSNDEVGIYFSYNYLEGTSRNVQTNTVPATNSFICESATRCYASSASRIYARGVFNLKNTEKELLPGQIAVVTSNEEVLALLDTGVEFRVQQDVTGYYADCENITGCGLTLLYDGKAPESLATAELYRHPRTIVGKKADGTVVLCVVDGRQPAKNMYGVAYYEMSALMKYYGCVEAYNLDGGGSTTMIIRNSNGDFDVQNSPSDGSERSDANALLVVVPQPNVKVNNATDTTIKLSYDDSARELNFKKVEVRITDGTNEIKKAISSTEEISGLKPSTSYDLYYEYEVEYNGKTYSGTAGPKKITTGRTSPTVEATYNSDEDFYYLEYNILDPEQTILNMTLCYGTTYKTISSKKGSVIVPKTDASGNDFEIDIMYDLGAKPGGTEQQTFSFVEEINEPDPTPIDEPQKGCKNAGFVVLELMSIISIMYIFKRHN